MSREIGEEMQQTLRKLAIVAPSLIATRKRHELAFTSIRSLRNCVGEDLPLYVVHDAPAKPRYLPRTVHELLPAARWDRTAESIYFGPKTRFVRRAGSGSASALREAVQLAALDSATHAFIHLDDHVYCPGVRKLLEYGVDALQRDADLLWVRFSGYPVIYNERKPLEVHENCVAFDTVNLNPTRRDEYTLWWSSLDTEIIRGRYWPVAMWFCIYRLPVLAELLDWAISAGAQHLAHVELHFRKEAGFEHLRTAYPNGRFGYVNMQYGGIEMHRNRNWRHLLKLPNQPLR